MLQQRIRFHAEQNIKRTSMTAHEIDYRVFGDDMQALEIQLDPGEAVRAEAGALILMEDGIEMQTEAEDSVFAGLKPILSGENFFITSFINSGEGKRHITFAAPFAGKIIPLQLRYLGGSFICQRNAFLCCAQGIDIDVEFTKRFGSGLFGSEGFVLERLTGDGHAFIQAGGTIVRRDLEGGETLRVDGGCLVALAPTVGYEIQFAGGIRNVLFGSEGLCLIKLTGPGTIYLQSLPFSRQADRIASLLV
jgi:uncharacterized protein (TIGR00266 family)